MGKLATSRRRVTRDNVEQEASGCSIRPSSASSGRAFVAVPVLGIVTSEPRAGQCGSIDRDPKCSAVSRGWNRPRNNPSTASDETFGAIDGARSRSDSDLKASVSRDRFVDSVSDENASAIEQACPRSGDPKDAVVTRSRIVDRLVNHRTTVSDENVIAIEQVGRGWDRRSLDNPGTRSSIETAAVGGPFDALHVDGNAVVRRDRSFRDDPRPGDSYVLSGGLVDGVGDARSSVTLGNSGTRSSVETAIDGRSVRAGNKVVRASSGDPRRPADGVRYDRSFSSGAVTLDDPGTRSSVETAVDVLSGAFHAVFRRDRRLHGDRRRPAGRDCVERKVDGGGRGRGWSIVLTAMAIVAVCAPVSGVPMPSRTDMLTGPRHDLDRSTGLEDVYEDAFEDAFREEDQRPTRTVLDDSELEIIRRSIARGLGLKRIPDPSRANVSQDEYERAHREYLKKVQLSFDERSSRSTKKLHVFHATAHPGNGSSRMYETNERGGRYRHRLYFPVEIPDGDDNASVDHATLRLLLHGHYSDRANVDVLLYLRTFGSRKLIVRKRIESRHSRDSRWLEFDSTVVVSSWLEAGLENLGLELEFLHDGEPTLRTFTSPVLNVFTERTAYESVGRVKRSTPEELMSLHKGRRTKCKGESKKCCRHELTVMFKELKGFEFIVYPRTFDAGYCKGRCPPRYNPAHHHALLQSLLWKEDKKKVPKPCCAPSKLDQLMIVYYDENNSTQLKVSYWKNIQVLECACS